MLTREDKDFQSFTEVSGEQARRVTQFSNSSANPLAAYFEKENTSSTVETYRFYESSSKSTLYNTLVITYEDSLKCDIVNGEWS